MGGKDGAGDIPYSSCLNIDETLKKTKLMILEIHSKITIKSVKKIEIKNKSYIYHYFFFNHL